MPSTLYLIAEKVARGLKLVDSLLQGSDGPKNLLGEMGWDLPSGVNDIGLHSLDFSDLLEKLAALDASIAAGESGVQLSGNYVALFSSLTTTLKNLVGIVGGFSAPGDYLSKSDIPNQFLTRLFDFMFVEMLKSNAMPIHTGSIFTGLIELRPFSRDDSVYQTEHVRCIIHWDKLPQLFSGPVDMLQTLSTWTGTIRDLVDDSTNGEQFFDISYNDAGKPISILSVIDGFGVEANQLALSGGIAISGGVLSPTFLGEMTGGHFFIDGSQMDSFLAKIIPLSIDVMFDFGIGWSGAYGFFFKGNASPSITIGLHESLGPFTLDTLHVALDLTGGDTLPLELSLSGKGALGPFNVTVDRIGLNIIVAFHKGNLGPLDLNLSFKPPTGLGMELDAGLIMVVVICT